MRISEYFGLDVTQSEIDFFDVDLDKDTPFYIDPFLISQLDNDWTINVDILIKNFFNTFKNLIIENKYEQAIDLLEVASEPKETGLGVSKTSTTNGKGVGRINATKIVDRIVESNAIQDGLVVNLEDIRIFVNNIDKDKISDMVTNIIRGELIEYTKEQCKLWNLPLTNSSTLPYWDALDNSWVHSTDELLFVDTRNILLIPKIIITPMNIYSAGKYDWYFVIEQERDFHLQKRSHLVKFKIRKSGREEAYVNKIDVQKDRNSALQALNITKKDFLRDYTLKYPDLFEGFVNRSKRTISPLSNEQLTTISSDYDLDVLIDGMISKLTSIPTGGENASNYHKYVKSLLEILFYPNLINPIIEKEIHQGRKRIDIMMTNNASRGFFHKMHDISKIFCNYVPIECKNYGSDIANPEIDQLSGRFSDRRGMFGLLLCRDLEDYDKFINRCKDTYNDGRGLVICLTDTDIVKMLNYIKSEQEHLIDGYLEEKKQEVIF